MKQLLFFSTILLLTSCASISQTTSVGITKTPFNVVGVTYIKPLISTVKGVPTITLNLNEMGLPVSTATKAAIDKKADITLVNSLLSTKADKTLIDTKANKADLVTKADVKTVTELQNAVNTLATKLITIPTNTPIVTPTINVDSIKTVLIGLQSNLLTLQKNDINLITNSTIDKKYFTDSLARLSKDLTFTYRMAVKLQAAIDGFPDLNWVGFNGKGTTTEPLENSPQIVTENERLTMTDVKPGKQVTQVGGIKTADGTYGFNAKSKQWILLY